MSGNGYLGFVGMLPRRRCVTTAMELQEQSKAAISNNRWTDVEMTHMLARFEDRQLSGTSSITPKWTDPIYETVSAELNRMGYPRTASQIRDQWNYLKKKYSRVRRGIQLVSNSSPMFQKYFEIVDRLLQREFRSKEQEQQQPAAMDTTEPLVVCITTPDIKQEMPAPASTAPAASSSTELATGNGQSHFWTEEETDVLLQCVEQYQFLNKQIDLDKQNIPQAYFEKIERKMRNAGLMKTVTQIRDRWGYLKKHYRRVRTRHLPSGQANDVWRFYERVDKLLRPVSTGDEVQQNGPGSENTACSWTDKETDVLLGYFEKFRQEYKNPDFRWVNCELYRKVEERMAKLGYTKTAAQIRNRWHNMRRQCQWIDGKGLSVEVATQQWKFFRRVRQLLLPTSDSDTHENHQTNKSDDGTPEDGDTEPTDDFDAEDVDIEDEQNQWTQNHTDRTWTVKETANLLQTLSKNSPFMNKRWGLITPVVLKIQEQLSREGFQRDITQIRSRWHHLKKHYHRLVDKGLSPKSAQKKWRYFDVVGKLLCTSFMAVNTDIDRRGGDVTYAETPPESSRTGSNQSSASEAASGSSSMGRTRMERNAFNDRIDSGNNTNATKPTSAITRSARADKVCNTASPSKSSDVSMSMVNDSAISGSNRRYDADIGASTSASSTETSSISRDFYLDFCKQQMDFMQQSHAQQLSWFKSQMEINQQNHVQQQAWFHEQMVLQRQKEEEMIRRQFEQSKIMTESIVYRLFDGMCQLADNIFNKSMTPPAVTPSCPKKTDAMSQLALASIDPTSSPARCVVPPVNLDSLACSPTGSGEVDRAVDCVTPDESSPTHVLQITQPFSMMDTSKSNEEP